MQNVNSLLTRLFQEAEDRMRDHQLSTDEQRHVIRLLSTLLLDTAKETERPLALDMRDIRGQEHVKRALEVAAAGGHNILLIGPPGAGKKVLAQTLGSILPQTTDPLPFRAPLATAELSTFVGSSEPFALGEVTLAHEGLLLLENLAAFRPPFLDALKEAVERHVVRPQGSQHLFFPAHFLLIATAEPCPCGFHLDPIRECTCVAEDIARYQHSFRQRMTSCFDIEVEVPSARPEALLDKRQGESSASIRRRVEGAREMQRRRFAGTPIGLNAALRSIEAIQHYGEMDHLAEKLLKAAMQQLHLSAQETVHLQRVARSIADLAESEIIAANHIAEATQYRSRFHR